MRTTHDREATPGEVGMAPTALTVTGLSKTFPGQRVLDSVNLEVRAGEVHGLIGQNGSGKSTLVKVLAGYHTPDSGSEVWVRGEPLALGSPAAARELGLRFVHQDLGLVGSLSVSDNFSLGVLGRRALTRNRVDRERDQAESAMRSLGYVVDPRLAVSELSASERTILAVARALIGWEEKASLLVIDEATASLPWAEASRLLDAIQGVASRGVAVIMVSHHLDEVLAATQRVTVLRDGRRAALLNTAETDHPTLVQAMLGRKLLADQSRDVPETVTSTAPVIEVTGLRGAVVNELNMSARAGEVVGVVGVTGSGREEVAGMLAGRLARGGAVSVGGSSVRAGQPSAAVSAGICYVPANRVAHALLGSGTVRENVTVASLGPVTRRGRLSHRRDRGETQRWVEALSIRPGGSDDPILTLSGGNQQKTVIARWLRVSPTVLLLDEPTQGVDIGSKLDIHRLVDRAAEAGAAVIICSTDSGEVARLCSVVHVMHRGSVIAVLRGGDVTADRIEEAQLQLSSATLPTCTTRL